MISSCGTTVSQNCSYIKNPGHPAAYTSTSSCSFTIQKCDSCNENHVICIDASSDTLFICIFSCVWCSLGLWAIYYQWTSTYKWSWRRTLSRYAHDHSKYWSSHSGDLWRKFRTTQLVYLTQLLRNRKILNSFSYSLFGFGKRFVR